MTKNKTIGYLFLVVGISNLVMMIDTLLTSSNHLFSIMSFQTSKEFNTFFYGIIGVFLLYAGHIQLNILTKNK